MEAIVKHKDSEDKMSMYSYQEIGKILGERNVKIGASFSFDDEGNLIKGIQEAINAGAKHLEIASLSRQGTARSFDLSSSIISEIGCIVRLSGATVGVHASPHLNISGFGTDGFSFETRNQAIREAKSSIDFAYAINAKLLVIHPYSFPRPVSNIDPEFKEESLKNFYLVEPRTERIVGVISEQDMVFIPQQAKDSRGSPLWLLDENRQPLLDRLAGKPIPRLATDENGRIRGAEMRFSEYIRRGKKEGKSLSEICNDFLHLQRLSEINRAYLGLAEAEKAILEAQSRRDRLQDTLDHYRKIDDVLSPDDRWRLEKIIPDRLSQLGVPSDAKSVVKLLEEELEANYRIIEAAKQNIMRGRPQLTQHIESFREVRPLEDHGLEKISEAIAELAAYSFSRSSGNPVRIAVENLPSPQMYGSCAMELLAIIEGARKNLAIRLKQRGCENPKTMAQNIIGATVDVGHFNLCRQFYKGDAFDKWMISEVRKLSKENNIFNLHLSDNRGIDDSHLPLGEGNTPIREILKVLAEDGYRGYIVVEGHPTPASTKHSFNLFGIVPRATDDELIKGFSPREAFGGLMQKDDPERPRLGREEWEGLK